MNRSSLAFVFAALTTSVIAGENCLVYFGCYTNAKSGSKGIYVARFNTTTGELSTPELAAVAASPSFLAVHPSLEFLYAVGERAESRLKGGVSAFKISKPDGKLTLINQVSAFGLGPCHINVDKTGKMAVIANYGGGSVGSFAIREDGSLSEKVSFYQHAGSSINVRRQAGPHAHSVNFSPDNRFVLACDLGLDKVMIYKADPAAARLKRNKPEYGVVPAGSGPRHLAFHPSGKYAFVNNEMLMSVTSFGYNAENGALTEIDTISTLPPEDLGKTGFSTAETVAHPNGKFVYVSNRTHDTIAVFTCDEATGRLTLIQNAPAEGQIPRNFCLDPTAKWMIVAHQDSNTAAVLKVDAETGKLSSTGTKVNVGGAVCVRFVPLD